MPIIIFRKFSPSSFILTEIFIVCKFWLHIGYFSIERHWEYNFFFSIFPNFGDQINNQPIHVIRKNNFDQLCQYHTEASQKVHNMDWSLIGKDIGEII